MIDKQLRIVNFIISNIVISAFITMFLLVFINVVMRFVFSSGLTFSDEIARYAFVWCTFLGALIALQTNAHIGITGIRPYLPVRYHRWLDFIANLVMLIVSGIVFLGSIQILMANIGTRAPFTGAPIAIAQASIITGTFGFLVIFLYRLWRSLHSDRNAP